MDGENSFGEALPAIVVFAIFGDNFEALEDVDDVVDSPFFDIEGFGDFVELEEFEISAFELI